MTQPIREPELLDPDRPLRSHGTEMERDKESDAELYKKALEESCGYAQQLWNDLDGLRTYLLESLPPDPRAPGRHPTASASPTGPDDDTGWDRWMNAYATVTSVLAGPHGDSGFGLSEARREAELRRSAPVLALPANHPGAYPQQSGSPARTVRYRTNPLHTAATIVLAALALRGLRPRPERDRPGY